MSPEAALTVWPPNAPTLFSIAVNSAKRITVPRRTGGQQDALVSVVFAAASLEAFLNESVHLADKSLEREAREIKLGHRVEKEPPIVSAFSQVMAEAEESRAQIQLKFQLAHLVLTRAVYEKGSARFQNFSDLILLMHGKSDETFLTVAGKPFVLSPASIVKKLASRNILAELSPGQKGHIGMAGDTALVDLIPLDEIGRRTSPASDVMARWTFVIGTKAVAEWACSSAAQMATDLMEKAPVSRWKEFMEGQYLKAFSAPL